jgi:phosphatidylserine/phosphatidylglycerophosphate/cardiolipin synthase-like enzyme
MKTLRVMMLTVFVGLLPALPVFAEGVTISVDRDRIPATPGEKTTIQIQVDIPTSGEIPRPDFFVSIPEGKLKDGRITNGEFINRDFHFLIYISAGRARGGATITYETADNPAAGEILVSVSGGQKGLGGLGVGAAGGSYATYRAQAKIILTAVPGSKLRPPAAKSPFSPTPSAVNPTPEIIKRLIPIAILLGGLGLVNHISARGKPQPIPERPSKEKQPEPESESKLPFREPVKKEEKKKEEPAQGGYRIFARLRPTQSIVVDAPAYRTYDYYGNGSEWIYLAVLAIPDKNTQVTSIEHLRWSAGDDPYERWDTVGPDESWDVGELPAGSSALYFRVQVPWEWRDKVISLRPPQVKLQLATSAEGLKTITGGSVVMKRDPLRPAFDVRGGIVTILGANPNVLIDPDPLEVLADGWNSTELRPTLELFYQPQPKEKLAIREVQAKIGATALPTANKHEERRKAKTQSRAPVKKATAKSDEPEKDEMLTWTPPFLVQEGGYVDIAELEVTWDWLGGPMWDLAPPDGRKDPIRGETCQVHLSGCAVQSEPVTNFFWPLNGMPVLASAQLIDGRRHRISSPLLKVDPKTKESRRGCYSQNAAFRCEIRDLSQGVASAPSGSKIPPQAIWNVDANVKPKAFLERIRAHPDQTLDLKVSETGQLYTSSSAELPPLWFESGDGGWATAFNPPEATIRLQDYATKESNEPIHDGPIFYTVIVDDGLGGKAEVTGTCRVSLGSLVLETGGADFSVYEYRPYLLEAEYQPARGYRTEIADQSVTLTWDFAVVNKDGEPVISANPNSPIQTEGNLGERFHLVLGHTPKSREEIYISRKDGEVRYKNPNGSAAEWFKVGPTDRSNSSALRRKWHEFQSLYEEEKALAWLPEASDGTQQAHPLPDTTTLRLPESGQIWLDKTLSLSVRVEMHLKGQGSQLLATSDRLTGGALIDHASGSEMAPLGTILMRTPPEFVWRDHRFKYVLLMLRLRLVDHAGNPYIDKSYRLAAQEIAGDAPSGKSVRVMEPVFGNTADHGLIEQLMHPDADTAELRFGDEGRDDTATFELKLGFLDEYDTISGAKARLNNLGLFAGPEVNDQEDEQFQRALQRFQTAYRREKVGPGPDPRADLNVTGQLDEATKIFLRELDKQFETHYESAPPVTPTISSTDTGASTIKEGDRNPIVNPLWPYPPRCLGDRREVCVAMHFPNTIRVPLDVNATEPRWFTQLVDGNGRPLAKTPGNEVTYLIDHKATFDAMARAIRTAVAPRHFVYLLAWIARLQDIGDIGGKTEGTLLHLLTAASHEHDVEVRAMFWRNIKERPAVLAGDFDAWDPRNQDQADFINQLRSGVAVLDYRTLDPTGSHHQKILVVYGSDGLIAFCGGIDPQDRHGRQHDVHAQIRGPAAYHLLDVFAERWADHPFPGADKRDWLSRELAKIEEQIKADSQRTPGSASPPALMEGRKALLARIGRISDASYRELLGENLLNGGGRSARAQGSTSSQWVQIGRTYGNGASHAGIDLQTPTVDPATGLTEFDTTQPFRGYGFAPHGEQTAKQMILHAIGQARRFIYIEDQYLVSMEISDALRAALPKIRHLTVVIPRHTDLMQTNMRRFLFIGNLVGGQPAEQQAKVRVFVRSQSQLYVHSKLYIMDDEFAIIGSANCNRRSLTHDSEAIAGIADEARANNTAYNFAHRLRIGLWAEHLFDIHIFDLQQSGDKKAQERAQRVFAELTDGVASAVHWLDGNRPTEAKVEPYDHLSLAADVLPQLRLRDDIVWAFADPDGS